MAVVYVGLKWTSNRYDDNRFQGFITYDVQGQDIPSALKWQCYLHQFSLLQTKYYVKNKGKSKFCRCFRVQFYCVRVWYPYVHSEGSL